MHTNFKEIQKSKKRVQKQFELGLLPIRIIYKKKLPKFKNKFIVNKETGELTTIKITHSHLEKIGVLNPKTLKVSLPKQTLLLLYELGYQNKKSKKRDKRILKQVMRVSLKIGKKHLRDGLNCKEWKELNFNKKSDKNESK